MKLLSKESFLFPTPKKLILTAVLFFIFGWIVYPITITSIITDWHPVGFPLTIRASGFCAPTFVCVEFNWFSLIIDILVWYTLSSVVIHKRLKFWVFCLCFIGLVLGVIAITFLLAFNDISFLV
jgi:hypothetical protein